MCEECVGLHKSYLAAKGRLEKAQEELARYSVDSNGDRFIAAWMARERELHTLRRLCKKKSGHAASHAAEMWRSRG